MAFTELDLRFRKSLDSLGGAMQTEEISDNTLANVFPNVSQAEAESGEIRYAAIYIYNANANSPANTNNIMLNPIAVVLQDSTSPNDEIALAWDPSGPGNSGQSIADQTTTPENIPQWYTGKDRTTGAVLGRDIAPGQGAMLWIKNTIKFNAGSVEGDTSVIDIITDNIPGAIDLPDSTSFVAFGDSDCNTTLSAIISKVTRRNPDFILPLGDNNAGSDASCFFKAWGDANINKMYPALGPFENTSAAKRNQYLNQFADLFVNTWDYFSVDILNIHLIVMDTNHAWNTASEQYDFIKRDLDRAAANPATDWIIVTSHDWWYSSWTRHLQLESDFSESPTDNITDIYHPLFAEHGVHLVLDGSPANTQQYYPLQHNSDSSSGFDVGSILQAQAPHYQIPTGQKSFPNAVIFIISGAGGYNPYTKKAEHETFHEGPAGEQSPDPAVAFANDTDFGYWYFVVQNNPTPKKLTASFYSKDDKLLYTFDITKL